MLGPYLDLAAHQCDGIVGLDKFWTDTIPFEQRTTDVTPYLRELRVCEAGLTVGALRGLQVELLILLIAADVSRLLQLFGGVIDFFLRSLFRNHLCV